MGTLRGKSFMECDCLSYPGNDCPPDGEVGSTGLQNHKVIDDEGDKYVKKSGK